MKKMTNFSAIRCIAAMPRIAIIALVAIIGFAMAACDDDDGGSSDCFIGQTLNLSGNVHTMDLDTIKLAINFKPYNGSLAIDTALTGGTGSITSGDFTFNLGTPDAGKLSSILDFLNDDDDDDEDGSYWDLTISNPDARFFSIPYFPISNSMLYDALARGNTSLRVNQGKNRITMTMSSTDVSYIYVDEEVTLKAKGFSDSETIDGDKVSIRVSSMNLTLKPGWNAMNYKMQMSISMSITGTSIDMSISMNAGDPASCRWILDNDLDNDFFDNRIKSMNIDSKLDLLKDFNFRTLNNLRIF